jgi:hypothetical protein
MRGGGAATETHAFALIQTLTSDGADVVKIESLTWSPASQSSGGVRAAVLFAKE